MRQSDWVSLLTFSEFTHNSHTHLTIEHTPFEALMGFTPHSLPTQFNSPSTPFISEFLDFLSHLWSDLLAAQKIANQTWNSNSHPIPYHIGDQVWLEGKNLQTSFPSYKLAPRHHSVVICSSKCANVGNVRSLRVLSLRSHQFYLGVSGVDVHNSVGERDKREST